jgi:hypothetical protein
MRQSRTPNLRSLAFVQDRIRQMATGMWFKDSGCSAGRWPVKIGLANRVLSDYACG